eukprot:TRINITY_DN96415_c0_g1_i1.p1 TRINITY_DN96415_c0_g1~~TRINITY_DN96415_c0_g1_i1.p1  ORF type:complete len:287 (-),score=32.70 TRINITY_DN96415_c0_g1_i1:106-966(-)
MAPLVNTGADHNVQMCLPTKGGITCCKASPVHYDPVMSMPMMELDSMESRGLRARMILDDAPAGDVCCSLWGWGGYGPTPNLRKLGDFSQKQDLPPVYTVEFVNIKGVKSMGLTYDVFLNTVVVDGIGRNSIAAKWNYHCPKAREIQRGDCLVQINGLSGSPKDIMDTIREMEMYPNLDRMVLTFKRAHLLNVSVSKFYKPLGVSLEPHDSDGVIISAIHNHGAVADWNRSWMRLNLDHPEHFRTKVQPQDRIVQVNGERRVAQILKILQEGWELNMVIQQFAQGA